MGNKTTFDIPRLAHDRTTRNWCTKGSKAMLDSYEVAGYIASVLLAPTLPAKNALPAQSLGTFAAPMPALEEPPPTAEDTTAIVASFTDSLETSAPKTHQASIDSCTAVAAMVDHRRLAAEADASFTPGRHIHDQRHLYSCRRDIRVGRFGNGCAPSRDASVVWHVVGGRRRPGHVGDTALLRRLGRGTVALRHLIRERHAKRCRPPGDTAPALQCHTVTRAVVPGPRRPYTRW
jgi:hypothetical protein